jgi:hypothetical protein
VKEKRKIQMEGIDSIDFVAAVGRALRRAGRDARKTARMYGTPVYIMKDGKVIAIKP